MAKKTCVGLFVDEDGLCAVEVAKTKAGYRLENLSTSAVSFSLVNGQIASPQDASVELQKFFDTAGLPHRNVVVGIPDQSTVTRMLNVPSMSRREMKEVMRGEAEQYVLFSGKEIALDFFVAEEKKEGGAKTNSVLLAAAPKDVVDSWALTFDEAGLELGCLTPTSIAFLNGVVEHERKSGFYAYLIFGNTATSLYLIRDGKLKFIRQVDFTRQTLENLRLDIEKYKKEIPDEAFAPIEGFIDELATTLDFYAQQNPREPRIEKIVMCANPTKYHTMEPYLAKRLDYSIDIENPVSWLDVDQSAISPAFLENFEYQIPYAAGLARTAIDEKEVLALNLLPEERKVTPQFKRLFGIQFGLIPAALVLIFLAVGFILNGNLKDAAGKLAAVDKEILQYQDQAKSIEALKKEKEEILASIKSMESGTVPSPVLAAGAVSFSHFFQELRRIMPKEVWIHEMQSEDGVSVTIEGYAKSQTGVSLFLKGMMATPVLASPALLHYSESASIDGVSVVKFKMLCMLQKGRPQ